MTITESVATRPAYIDEAVVNYTPALKSMAARLFRANDDFTKQLRNELVIETQTTALEKWETFREDGGIYLWLMWRMRDVHNRMMRDLKRRRHTYSYQSGKLAHDGAGGNTGGTASDDPDYVLGRITDGIDPAQHHSLEVKQAIEHAMKTTEGRQLLQWAIGYSLDEIDDTVSRQAVNQRITRARKALTVAMNVAA